MTGYLLTPAARGDLSSFCDHTEERWGVAQPEIYIGDVPRRGRAREKFARAT